MLVALLVAAAVYVVAGPQLLDSVKAAAGSVPLPQLERKHVAGAALLAAAAVAYGYRSPAVPTPAPGPAPDARLVLRGTFVGPDASADAATVSALMDELAAEIEWDGMQPEQLVRTGVAVDDLRQRARELRCRGISLGEKHPRAREAIKSYLDQTAGTSGGPLTPAQRSAWVAAYRDIARAAGDAAR
jgi:hypothetical protein